MHENIRLLIADDHEIVRNGLRVLLETETDFDIVDEAADGLEAVQKYRLLEPDILLMDLAMPHKTGVEAIEEIIAENPYAKILVLSSYSDDEKVLAAIKAGASGYLLKASPIPDLIQAIRDVHRGESALHPAVASTLIRELNLPTHVPPTEALLTGRESDVLHLIATGASNQEVAHCLVLTERTVRTHVTNILNKLHLDNRTQAAIYALKEGLVTLEA